MSHNISKEEIYSFTQYININLKKSSQCRKFLPISPDSDALFDVLWDSNGLILQQLIHMATKDQSSLISSFSTFKIPEKPNPFQTLQNLNCCIEGAKKIGCKIMGVSGDDFKEKKQYLVLAVLWQVIRRCLGVKIGAKSAIKDDEIEPVIIQWANGILGQSRELKDYGAPEVLNALMREVARQNLIEFASDEMDETAMLNQCFLIADELQIERFARVEDLKNRNGKIVLAFLAEVFSQVISQEIAIGQDSAIAQMKRISVVKSIKNGFQESVVFMSFKQGMLWDQSRASGFLDSTELCIFILTILDDLKIRNSDEFQSLQYSFLLPKLTEKEQLSLMLQTVKLLRDCLDQILFQNKVDIELFRILVTSLMVLVSDESNRVELLGISFGSTMNRLLMVSGNQKLIAPIFLFGNTMDMESNTVIYFDIFKSFYDQLDKNMLYKLNFTEFNAIIFSLQQIQLVDQTSQKLFLDYSFENMYKNISQYTIQDLSLFYNTLKNSSYGFDEMQKILESSIKNVVLVQTKDSSLGSLLKLQNINFLVILLAKYPELSLKYLQSSNIHIEAIKVVNNINYDNLQDSTYQREIYSSAYLLNAVRKALQLNSNDVFSNIDKQLRFVQDKFEELYVYLVENQLGNQSIRSTARYLVQGLLEIDDVIINKFMEYLETSAKSSSFTAFIQSMKDMEITAQYINSQQLVNTLNWVFAGLAKFQDIELVMKQSLQTLISLSVYSPQLIITSLGLTEITNTLIPWINESNILSLYLVLIQTLSSSPNASLPTFIVSFKILQRIPTQFSHILPQYYKTLQSLANSSKTAKYFQNYLGFWNNIIEHLSSGIIVARAVSACILKVVEAGYILFEQAQQINLFEKIELYGKGYHDEELNNNISKIIAFYVYYTNE